MFCLNLFFLDPGQSLIDALDARKSLAANRAAIDFAFHMTLASANRSTLDEIPSMIEAGVTSFKAYTTYEGLRLTDGDFLKALKHICNLKFFFDEDNQKVYIEPETDFITDNVRDISDRVINYMGICFM